MQPEDESSGQSESKQPTADMEHGSDEHKTRKPTWLRWLKHRFTWSWFTCTQSTGGVAILLSECPKQFYGLQTIGIVIFLFNLVLWAAFTSLMLLRWILHPRTFRRSFTEAPECYFFGSFWLTGATVVMSMQRFGLPHTGPWMIVAIRICFWIYAAVSLLSATMHFVIIFKHTDQTAIQMNPGWFILWFNAMLTGTIAATIAQDQPPAHRLPIIIAGVAYQGWGWIGSLVTLAWFFGRLMEKGWPPPSQAPGLFITVGSVGYTIVALIGNARALPTDYQYFLTHPMGKEVLVVMATWASIFMWLFAFWLFAVALLVSVASSLKNEHGKWTAPMHFNNTWWAMIFPNVGYVLATIYIGQELESNAVEWVATAMVILLVATWLASMLLMIKTVYKSLFVDYEKNPV